MEANWSLARKRQALIERARIVQTIRAFFIDRDFLEVETPQRLPANAPEPHIDAVASGDWFLQTSPELCMKRLLAAGYPRLFQLGKVWRAGERGGRHLPEFTLLEWYRRDTDYHALMDDCEGLLRALVPGGSLTVAGRGINLAPQWERLTVVKAFTRHASVPLAAALASGRFEEILTSEVEPHLGSNAPIFLTEYPVELAALARPKPGDVSVAERFELYLGGIEVANAFSELTDPIEQRRRFLHDEAARRASGKVPAPLPEAFLRDLAALPAAAGIALGVDRLVMLLTGAERIDDVVAFTPDDL
ncbi:MAG: EF-P lysine aminoacylase GenX [Desulfuromonadales bacterium GWD2_61_12]|nr:MAG: EF-P lysine aminoacylase GenX [Desulfuromonadales bacterium GWC2_61_20]OGR33639.1 MAG: EF-P lysine aminoacylase GenX [Desulfuromonadales bacterium GWD2_61_12]HAD04776.1 EF-P lysine aminoacylase GenX [Desulfuromonas sp.]HBT82351.1 EF-P lysine aminoacylase GenX [Desulfuromonas sp.]